MGPAGVVSVSDWESESASGPRLFAKPRRSLIRSGTGSKKKKAASNYNSGRNTPRAGVLAECTFNEILLRHSPHLGLVNYPYIKHHTVAIKYGRLTCTALRPKGQSGFPPRDYAPPSAARLSAATAYNGFASYTCRIPHTSWRVRAPTAFSTQGIFEKT